MPLSMTAVVNLLRKSLGNVFSWLASDSCLDELSKNPIFAFDTFHFILLIVLALICRSWKVRILP